MIARDAREDGPVFGAEVYVLDEEGVPFRCSGAEDGYVSMSAYLLSSRPAACVYADIRGLGEMCRCLRTSSICPHARRPDGIMLIEAALFDELLGHDIAG